jgi:protein-tyrosine phosphatase
LTEFLKLTKSNTGQAARAAARALERGPVVAPVLDCHAVLGSALPTRLGCCRLFGTAAEAQAALAGLAAALPAGVPKLLEQGAVLRVGAGTGVALARGGFEQELVRALGEPVTVSVPDDGTEPGELADELGSRAALVVTGDSRRRAGPTVLDVGGRPVRVDRKGKPAILDAEAELGELVRLGPGLFFSTLVVCTGNSCRSPMAAGLLGRELGQAAAFVFSAGTDAPVGAAATPAAVEVGRRFGFDLTAHRAQQLLPEMVRGADLVIVMERRHQAQVLALEPETGGRVRLLRSFGGEPDREVEDPVGRSLEFYIETMARMQPALERVARDIRFRLDS